MVTVEFTISCLMHHFHFCFSVTEWNIHKFLFGLGMRQREMFLMNHADHSGGGGFPQENILSSKNIYLWLFFAVIFLELKRAILLILNIEHNVFIYTEIITFVTNDQLSSVWCPLNITPNSPRQNVN